MPEHPEIIVGFAGPPRQKCGLEFHAAVEAERQELATHLAAFFQELRAERFARELRLWLSLWPVAAGLLLGAFAPGLHASIAVHAPWAVTGVFPFLILAGRPEVQMLGRFGRAAPVFMLYAQFPLEGLFAWIILKRRTTLVGVGGQVSLLHFLGAVHLWLLGGGLIRVLAN